MDPSGSRAPKAGATVRGAKPADAADLERIEAVSFDGDWLSRRSLRHHLQSKTADVFVAELARTIIGYAIMFYRRTSTVGRLYSIAIMPEARGKGVGEKLVAACERAARARGCRTLQLEVHTNNAGAIRLYERLGYVHFGRHENYYHDGAPALRLAKPLTSRQAKAQSAGKKAA